MEKKYYHDTYFQKIMQIMQEERYIEAVYEFQKYLKIYPNDVNGYTYYANTLMKLNRLEEAEAILKQVKDLINRNTSTSSYEDYLREKITLLCCQKKYEEAYFLFRKNISMYYRRKWIFKGLFPFLKKQLGLLTEEDYVRERGSYLIEQILSYSESLALEHIKKHQSNEIDVPLQFVSTFPIEKIYYDIRAMLPTTYKYNSDGISNSYVFKYAACGHAHTQLVDFLEVIALQDSNDILTMYPYENRERREYIDITPLEDVSLLRKRSSQIDKFNQKYGKREK